MARLHTCTDEELGTKLTTQLFDVVPGKTLPEVYRQMGNSTGALSAYLSMESAIREGSLELREIEAVKLAVSQLNQCDYCLSVHTFKSKQAGIDADTQMAIRKGESTGEKKLDAMLAIVRRFFEQPGELPDAMLVAARDAGVTDKNLLDLVLVTTTIFLTNTFNHINDTELSFKQAPAVDA